MHILLTGATGFVGSALAQRLYTLPQATLTPALRRPHPAYPQAPIVGTINQHTDWTAALRGIDTIIHLAAYAHVTQKSQVDPQALYDTNVLGTKNLIKQAVPAGVKRVIFISSIGAMASTSPAPLSETSPCQPDSLYGRSKLMAEQELIQLSQTTPLTYTILRPPLVYGPGNPGNMARLENLLRLQLPLPLAAIHNQRSLIYLPNLVDAILTCLTHPQARNQTFLVSDGQDLSTPQLLQKIAHHAHLPCRLFPLPLPLLTTAGHLGDHLETLLHRPLPLNGDTILKLTQSLPIDSRKIRDTLQWQPPYTVDQGLAEMGKERRRAQRGSREWGIGSRAFRREF
jgi:nucleoside-diphosphate-sugar epimerase